MAYFLCRLLPPRPTFIADMTRAEGTAMQQHMTYWRAYAEKGVAIAFGPVADPKGPWGLGIVEAKSDQEVKQLCDDDPVIKANLGLRYEILPIPSLLIGTRS